jgi:hypothetical protein
MLQRQKTNVKSITSSMPKQSNLFLQSDDQIIETFCKKYILFYIGFDNI